MTDSIPLDVRRQDVIDLEAGRALLSDPTRWCKSAYARNAKGDPVLEGASDACSWCSMGALRKIIADSVTGDDIWRLDKHYSRLNGLRGLLNQACFPTYHHILDVNDHQSHDVLLGVWDVAIAAAKDKLAAAEAAAA